MTKKAKPNKRTGNLRAELLETAELRIKEGGIGALSLRKLAQDASVTTMATYHHFTNKEALLVQIAIIGFNRLGTAIMDSQSSEASQTQNIKAIMRSYVKFALDNTAVYHLMFGQEIQGKQLIPEFKEASRKNFYLMANSLKKHLEADGRVVDVDNVGISFWATLHGLVCLISDGTLFYSSRSDSKLELLIDRAAKGLYLID